MEEIEAVCGARLSWYRVNRLSEAIDDTFEQWSEGFEQAREHDRSLE